VSKLAKECPVTMTAVGDLPECGSFIASDKNKASSLSAYFTG